MLALISSREWIESRMTSSNVVSFNNVEYEHVELDCVSTSFGGDVYSSICSRGRWQGMLVSGYIIEGSIVSVCQLYYHRVCRKWVMKLANLQSF
jgi:hypothetical protein